MLVLLRARRRSPLDDRDVSRLRLTVLPTDIDVLGHINNGVYFSLMDLGRFDFSVRSGLWAAFRRLGIYPVAVHETVTFRRSLDLWARYELQSKILGYSDRVVYFEHRFVRGEEVYARGVVGARFLRRSGGALDTADLLDLLEKERTGWELPAWVERWADDTALPSNRQPYPSDWDI